MNWRASRIERAEADDVVPRAGLLADVPDAAAGEEVEARVVAAARRPGGVDGVQERRLGGQVGAAPRGSTASGAIREMGRGQRQHVLELLGGVDRVAGLQHQLARCPRRASPRSGCRLPHQPAVGEQRRELARPPPAGRRSVERPRASWASRSSASRRVTLPRPSRSMSDVDVEGRLAAGRQRHQAASAAASEQPGAITGSRPRRARRISSTARARSARVELARSPRRRGCRRGGPSRSRGSPRGSAAGPRRSPRAPLGLGIGGRRRPAARASSGQATAATTTSATAAIRRPASTPARLSARARAVAARPRAAAALAARRGRARPGGDQAAERP